MAMRVHEAVAPDFKNNTTTEVLESLSLIAHENRLNFKHPSTEPLLKVLAGRKAEALQGERVFYFEGLERTVGLHDEIWKDCLDRGLWNVLAVGESETFGFLIKGKAEAWLVERRPNRLPLFESVHPGLKRDIFRHLVWSHF